MSWYLQSPQSKGQKLIEAIASECSGATAAGAAFAFASATGVKLFAAETSVAAMLKKTKFTLVVGLDAITDTGALQALRDLRKEYPLLDPWAFIHDTKMACFHPKTLWFRKPNEGVVITGSGNLTTGGLRENWEATWVQRMSAVDVAAFEKQWNDWIAGHKANLFAIDSKEAIDQAEENRKRKVRVRKAVTLKLSEEADEEALEEIETTIALNPVLLAEVPKSGDRWKQVNFDVDTYQQYFGVTIGTPKKIRLYKVNGDGSLDAPEEPPAVAVKSSNYRFEIGAAQGLPYPKAGHPILAFERIGDSTFKYMLLMPGDANHTLIQTYIDKNYAKSGNKKRRLKITSGELKKAWPNCPMLT